MRCLQSVLLGLWIGKFQDRPLSLSGNIPSAPTLPKSKLFFPAKLPGENTEGLRRILFGDSESESATDCIRSRYIQGDDCKSIK